MHLSSTDKEIKLPFNDDEKDETPQDDAPNGVDAQDDSADTDVDNIDEKLISQKELDRILQKRLKRQEDAMAKKYADYDTIKADAEAFRKLADEKATDSERWEKEKANLLAQTSEFQTELTKLQRTNLIADLATDAGLPKSFWKRVSGDSEEEIQEDIDSILNDLGGSTTKGSKETNASKTAKKTVYGGGGENEAPDPDTDQIVSKIPRGPQFRVDKPRSYK